MPGLPHSSLPRLQRVGVQVRRIRFDEGDLKIIFSQFMEPGGFIHEGEDIIGFEYKTRRIKKGGDYYKDGITDPDYPADGVEVITWVKVLLSKGKRSKVEKEEPNEKPD